MSTFDFTRVPEIVEGYGLLQGAIFGPAIEAFQAAGQVIKNSEQVDPTIEELTDNFKKFEMGYNEVAVAYADSMQEANKYGEIKEKLEKTSLNVDMRQADVGQVKQSANPEAVKGL